MPPLDLTFGRKRHGSALILVLWCLLILGMAVLSTVELVELSVENTSHLELASEARTLAMSGIALGLNPQLVKGDPLFSQKPAADEKFDVAIESEGARLNLNYVLLNNHREILVNLFTQWGLSIADADHVADCLYDWVTPGDLKSLNGAKAGDYASAGLSQRPSHQAFTSFAEVEEVMGMDLVEKAKANWQDSLTLWSGGPLNVNEAPADLIAAVFGLEPGRVEAFTAARNGEDGIAGTLDDHPVTDLKTFQGELSLTDLSMTTLGSEISLSDPNRRVKSVGQAGDVRVTISIVSQMGVIPTKYLLWSEQN